MTTHSVKMASLGEPEESVFEYQRPSLLDAVEDKNRAMNKKGLLHRMVIISKMQHNNFVQIGQYYEQWFKELTSQHQTEGVTGLLLLYPKHCVHVLESSEDILLEHVRDLHQDQEAGQGNMEQSKIVIISHDIAHRLYQQWSYHVLDIEAPKLEDYDMTEEPAHLVLEMLTQLLKLGAYISRQPKMGLKNTMESLHDKVPELLPQQDVLGFLLENDEEVTTTPQEHLNKYQKPYTVTLASELVWPMPVRIFPYN